MNALLRLLLLTLALLAAPAAVAQAAGEPRTWPATIGEDRLVLPVPPGYAEATLLMPRLRQIGERLTPPTNRLLAYLVDEQEFEALRSGARKNFERYFLIQTLREAEAMRLDADDFSHGQAALRSQYRDALQRGGQTAQSHLDSVTRELRESGAPQTPGLRLGEIRGLGVFVDEPGTIGFLVLTRLAVEELGSTTEVPMVAALTTVLVAGKVILFYAFSRLRGEPDLDWVRAQSLAWLKQAKERNR